MRINIVIRSYAALFLFCLFSSMAQAQSYRNYDDGKDDGGIPPRFATENKEISFLCAPFLPNQIGGITELMTLCGGRFGFKVGQRTFMEGTVLSGAAHAQRYILGSLGFRTDVAYDDVIASIFFGGDIHYPTQPTFDPVTGFVNGEQTTIYFGGHVGGSLWGQIADNFYIRTDMQFNFNPGTSLFIGFGIVLRFDRGAWGQDKADQQPFGR